MRPPVRIALAVVAVALLVLGAWALWGADASEEEVAPASVANVAPDAVIAPELTVANVRMAGGEVSASVTNTESESMDRVVVRFDLFSGGAPAGDASAVAFGVAPGATVRVSSTVPGPVTIDSVVVRETVATPGL